MKIFEARFLKMVCGHAVADFLRKMYRQEYRWSINYLYGSGDDSVTKIPIVDWEDRIEKYPDGYPIAWEELLYVLENFFQIYDVTIEAYQQDGHKAFIFEVIDVGLASFGYENEETFEDFQRVVEGWIDLDHPFPLLQGNMQE